MHIVSIAPTLVLHSQLLRMCVQVLSIPHSLCSSAHSCLCDPCCRRLSPLVAVMPPHVQGSGACSHLHKVPIGQSVRCRACGHMQSNLVAQQPTVPVGNTWGHLPQGRFCLQTGRTVAQHLPGGSSCCKALSALDCAICCDRSRARCQHSTLHVHIPLCLLMLG